MWLRPPALQSADSNAVPAGAWAAWTSETLDRLSRTTKAGARSGLLTYQLVGLRLAILPARSHVASQHSGPNEHRASPFS
jgi:hypothetical protein